MATGLSAVGFSGRGSAPVGTNFVPVSEESVDSIGCATVLCLQGLFGRAGAVRHSHVFGV